MSNLIDYILKHTNCSSDQFKACPEISGTENPAVNVFFFNVSIDESTSEDFIRLTNEHKGAFADVNPFDGEEHGYIELGGWIGDQGLALRYMAIGKQLGLWKIIHPGMILDVNDPQQKELANEMAGAGMVSILPN